MSTSPLFGTRFFWNTKDPKAIIQARDDIVAQFRSPMATFSSDNLIAWGRNLGFLHDRAFMQAFSANAVDLMERGIIWRTAGLVWAARQGLRLEGDFVECGCYKGTSARIVADTINFKSTGRAFYLYDLFEHDSSMPHPKMPHHSSQLFESVVERFSDMPTTKIIKGFLPESLAQGVPEKIAYLHLDLNNAAAEIGTLEVLWDRMVPGAVLVLDDFGASPFQDSHVAETKWFAQRGYSVLELPTSQGIVIK